MGLKKLFTYEITLAPVPDGNDAVAQELQCDGVYLTPDEPHGTTIMAAGPEGGVKTIQAIEERFVTLSLSYYDAANNQSLPLIVGPFEVVDEVAPDMPAGMSIAQTNQSVVDIPDQTPDPDPTPDPE